MKNSAHLFLLFTFFLVACGSKGLPADRPASRYASPQELIAALESDGVLSCRSFEDTTPAGDIGITSGHCVAVFEDNTPVPLLVTVFSDFGVSSGGLDTYVNSYQEAARANKGDPILLVGPNWVLSSQRQSLIAIQDVIGGSLKE